MDTVYAVCAAVCLSAGVVLAFVHLGASAIAALRKRPGRPELVSSGHIVNGLGLALTAFYLTRGISAGEWGGVDDLRGLLVVLAAASWGYGAAHAWWVALDVTHRPRWVTPLALSALTGLFVGLSSGLLQV